MEYTNECSSLNASVETNIAPSADTLMKTSPICSVVGDSFTNEADHHDASSVGTNNACNTMLEFNVGREVTSNYLSMGDAVCEDSSIPGNDSAPSLERAVLNAVESDVCDKLTVEDVQDISFQKKSELSSVMDVHSIPVSLKSRAESSTSKILVDQINVNILNVLASNLPSAEEVSGTSTTIKENSTAVITTFEAISSLPSKSSDSEAVIPLDISDEEEYSKSEVNDEQNNFQSSASHRGAVVPYSDTEDSYSSSSSSSYDDSSDDSCEPEDGNADSDIESEGLKAKVSSVKPSKVQGELDIDDLPPIEDLQISVRSDQAAEIGKVLHTVDTLVVVESYKDQPPLDIDSVLFLDGGARPLGRIFDVLGPVTEPLYCVRFNSKEHIEEQNILPGMVVYCAPQTEHSNFVFVKHLMMMKGSDASWKKDREIALDQMDFSDDEEEAKARRMKKAESKKTLSPQEPQTKSSKIEKQSNSQQVKAVRCQRGRGGDFQPRNPWGWSGARHSFSGNPNQGTSSYQQSQFTSRDPVRPSSFNAESTIPCQPHYLPGRTGTGQQRNPAYHQFSSQSRPPTHSSKIYGTPRHPSYPQFGRDSNPRMFSQLPPNSFESRNSSWGPGWTQPDPNQYNHVDSYNPVPHRSSYQATPQFHNTGDQRYQAFQSEIARLVDAYNSGAESPLPITQHRPPGSLRPPPPTGPDFNNSHYQSYFPG